MAKETPTEQQAHDARFPSLFRLDWFAVHLYSGVLSAAAKQIRYHAGYLKKLSEVGQPSDVSTGGREPVKNAVSGLAAGLRKLFNRNVALICASRQVS